MPHTSQIKVLEVVKNKTMDNNERYDGYRVALIKTMSEIMALENSRPYNVRQQVSRKISALAENLVKEKGDME